eukprot:TRINITY_DN63867_c0_g1_i1.p1 TRINITY_DN63867_c0_g1~~TRINITY_DN63867_c0_g1_i1.p1  ORF type:complete len:129 (+),score=27.51 TRINITY_DN63867_c0_g1_i1:43-429(+)
MPCQPAMGGCKPFALSVDSEVVDDVPRSPGKKKVHWREEGMVQVLQYSIPEEHLSIRALPLRQTGVWLAFALTLGTVAASSFQSKAADKHVDSSAATMLTREMGVFALSVLVVLQLAFISMTFGGKGP